MHSTMSPAERDTRIQLAACYRLVSHFGMSDLIYNHITARIPGPEGHLLINPYGMMYDEITASSLVRIDLDGNVLDNPGEYGINAAGYVIHSAVHAPATTCNASSTRIRAPAWRCRRCNAACCR